MFDFTFNVLKMHFIVTYVDRQHSLEIVKSDVSARFVLYFITNNLKWELVKPIKKMVTYRIYIFDSKLSFSLVICFFFPLGGNSISDLTTCQSGVCNV